MPRLLGYQEQSQSSSEIARARRYTHMKRCGASWYILVCEKVDTVQET